MASEIWDVIVVGGGVIGLSTAYHTSKAGLKTLLIEQFYIPHTRGSSHGQSRLIRKVGLTDNFTSIMTEAYQLWRDIEKESSEELLKVTGLVMLEKGESQGLQVAEQAMIRHNVDHEVLNAKSLKKKYPMTEFEEGYHGILDKTAGVLYADKCLQVLRDLIRRHGGVIKDGISIQGVYPAKIVTLTSQKGTYQCRHLVVTPGPWAADWMKRLQLPNLFRTMPGKHMFWKVESPVRGFMPTFEDETNITYPESSYRFVLYFPPLEYSNMVKTMPGLHMYWNKGSLPYEHLPSMKDETNVTYPDSTYRNFYIFPSLEYPNLTKIVTRGEPAPFYCHPDERDVKSMQDMVQIVSAYIARHYPGVATKPSILESCMYTMTPDRWPVIDRHPDHTNIVIGAGFSGLGFMMAPLAGKILHELVSDNNRSRDITSFKFDRFAEARIKSRL